MATAEQARCAATRSASGASARMSPLSARNVSDTRPRAAWRMPPAVPIGPRLDDVLELEAERALAEAGLDRVGQVAAAEDHARHPGLGEPLEHVGEQRPAEQREHGLGSFQGERAQARALPAHEHDGIHALTLTRPALLLATPDALVGESGGARGLGIEQVAAVDHERRAHDRAAASRRANGARTPATRSRSRPRRRRARPRARSRSSSMPRGSSAGRLARARRSGRSPRRGRPRRSGARRARRSRPRACRPCRA